MLCEDIVENKENSFIDCVISVRRVTKVTKGGKRFSFSAQVVSGDQQGRVGIARGSSHEASLAVTKATKSARRNLATIALRGTTVPYEVKGSHGASQVTVRPASKGTGRIAGGAVRAVLKAAGVVDVLTKAHGSSNGINVAKATLNALAQMRTVVDIARLRGKTVQEIIRGSDVTT